MSGIDLLKYKRRTCSIICIQSYSLILRTCSYSFSLITLFFKLKQKPQKQPFIKSNRTPHATTRSPSPGKLDRHRPAVLPPSLSLPDVVPLLCSTLLFSISGDCFQFQVMKLSQPLVFNFR